MAQGRVTSIDASRLHLCPCNHIQMVKLGPSTEAEGLTWSGESRYATKGVWIKYLPCHTPPFGWIYLSHLPGNMNATLSLSPVHWLPPTRKSRESLTASLVAEPMPVDSFYCRRFQRVMRQNLLTLQVQNRQTRLELTAPLKDLTYEMLHWLHRSQSCCTFPCCVG